MAKTPVMEENRAAIPKDCGENSLVMTGAAKMLMACANTVPEVNLSTSTTNPALGRPGLSVMARSTVSVVFSPILIRVTQEIPQKEVVDGVAASASVRLGSGELSFDLANE
jgi:hypothetical protein